MNTVRLNIRFAVIVTGACLILNALGGQAIAQETIKIAYINQIHDAALMLVEKQLGSKYHLQFIRFLRYSDSEVALVRGDVQVASLGYTNPIAASLREKAASYKLVTGLSRGAINVVCNKNAKVRTWDDLKGKKFGLLAGGPAELFFDDAITEHGLKRSDIPAVTFTTPGPPLMQALQNGTVECSALYEPLAAAAVQQGTAVYVPGVDLAQNSFHGINSALAVNSEFLKTHQQFAQDIVNVVVNGTKYYNAHKDKLDTDFKRIEFSPAVIKIGENKVILDDRLYFKSALSEAKAMLKLGFIRALPDSSKLLSYYDYQYLSKTTGQEPGALGKNE